VLRTIASRSRFGVGSVRVTSMYSVITGRRVNLLSLGPSLYSVTRSTASARYDSGARNFSGCSSGVTGVIQVQRRRPELQRAMLAIPFLHPASRARAGSALYIFSKVYTRTWSSGHYKPSTTG
jgi:hypothetical protein